MTVVALVPAKDKGGSVADTVAALLSLDAVDEVMVVDDGSTDETAEAALSAGARVLRLPRNVGKGAAVAAGVAATPEADVYLLVDADVGSTAAVTDRLLAPVLEGHADLAVAVLPGAGRRAGFGTVRSLAEAGIRRATGEGARAPLSGQRAIRAELLRSLPLAERFGLETAMTVDARRAGARMVEVDLPMDHRHTGRSWSGFAHRARQGGDVVRALWPRLTSPAQRTGAVVVALGLFAGIALWSAARSEPASVAPAARPSKVVLFGVPKLGWKDVGTGAMPNLDRLMERGAVAATSVRTLTTTRSTTEGYVTLGAGSRLGAELEGGYAFDAGEPLEGGTAAEALERRTGAAPRGQVVVVGAPATARVNRGKHLPGRPGALADALHGAGLRTAVVGNADINFPIEDRPPQLRPAAVAMMSSAGVVDAGTVGTSLLRPGALAAERASVAREAAAALDRADVVLVDPGDMDRAAEFAAVASPSAAAAARRRALRATDAMLGDVARLAGEDSLVLVVSVVPPGTDWHVTPMVASGKGVHRGYLHSLSTRRSGVVTLTDVAPTVLEALDVPVPDGMIGHPLRYQPGRADLDRLREIDRDAGFRETFYFRLTLIYIAVQALVYLMAIVAFSRLGGAGRAGSVLRATVLAVAAWPLATFLLRSAPDVAALGPGALVVLVAIDVAIVALAWRARRHALSPLAWICGATVAVLVIDVCTGARLQLSSLLGYSLHSAARFTGFGNTAFAALAATTIIAGALHVHHAPRRPEAVVTVACLFAAVVLADGAPSLGSDVGGILTLVPVLGVSLLALAGRRVSWRSVAVAALAALVLLALATGVDMLRPPDARTHLGQLVTQVQREGWSPLLTTVGRKAAGNLRTYGSPWTWTVPVMAVYMLWMLAWSRGLSALVPPRSALRVGVVGVVAAGILGNLLNDSGVVVTAVVIVYLGPFLTLLALAREDGEPVLLEPDAAQLPPISPLAARAGP